MNQLLTLIPFPLSAVAFFVWVIRRRKAKSPEKKEAVAPYSTAQVLGIVGLILFVLPIFVIALLTLAKPMLVAGVWLFSKLGLPKLVTSVLTGVLAFLVLTCMWVGAFLLSEYLWPKRAPLT